MLQVLIHQTLLLQNQILINQINNLEKVTNDLISLKSKVDELDLGKLKTTSIDLSKLSDVVKK